MAGGKTARYKKMNDKPSVRQDVVRMFSEALRAQGVAVPGTLPDDMPLLKSGLDSLGFARLVMKLGDFIAAYEKIAGRRLTPVPGRTPS